MIDDILKYNEQYVAQRGYEKHITSKFPDLGVMVITCMDTRLSVMLTDALGLRNGDAKICKVAGGVIGSDYGSVVRSVLVGIYELGVEEIMVIHHTDCGACKMSGHHMVELMRERGIGDEAIAQASASVDLEQWLEGFHDTERSVRDTVERLRRHPLVPAGVVVRGFIIDSTTGRLTEVK